MLSCSSPQAMDYYLGNPNPTNNPHNNESFDPLADLELPNYLMLDDGFGDDSSSKSMVSPEHAISGGSAGNKGAPSSNNTNNKRKSGLAKSKMEVVHRVAFRTKSEQEVMDDGFKWRKYGKKSVKNSPNPRNYYKCSSEGCKVKKRVERDREDRGYVITTYEGVHNHESPCEAYYNKISTTDLPDCWSIQDSSSQASFPS